MRLLFLGDIVGRPGRKAFTERVPALRERWRLDCVIVNGENAAGGFGITETICDEILASGADAVTLGNHSWDQREALVFIERQPRLVRPANFPPGTPGRGATMVETRQGARVLVVDVLGAGSALAGSLRRAGSDVVLVEEAGLGSAAAAADVVLLEARALGPSGFVAGAGSLAAAAVGHASGVAVWVVAGAGRVLPGPLWDALLARLADGPEPWEAGYELVPLRLADRVVGPAGPGPAGDAPARADCPPVPELTRTWAAPGSRGRGPLPGGG